MNGSGGIIWRKAAVIGSIWAASEIVLGSFLHNVRVPFTGEILTAIGIAVLVAGHRLWPERGLLWRAGLVCALMKSISPSAVIFGPMIAIAMEGALAELGVRLLRGPAGYLLGGGLAMSWALAQKTLNLLILYGPDMIDVYLRGAGWLLPRLGLGAGGVWAPLQAAFAVYFLAGAAAAAAGMCVKQEAGARYEARPRPAAGAAQRDALRPHSTALLFFHAIFSVLVLGAGRRIPLPLTAAGACLYGLFCARRYPRVRLMFGHAGLWAGVFLAALSAGLVLGSVEAGAYMAFRAVLLTSAFAALGGELKGRAVRAFV
ncbi:MAG TPA: hypothetical protein PL037_07990, partial [Elusimicrobiales bacterium]|nr:hypothetical protein [Elusimicrobiales bacterium]